MLLLKEMKNLIVSSAAARKESMQPESEQRKDDSHVSQDTHAFPLGSAASKSDRASEMAPI
jgi:hypothetical protein